MSTCIDCGNEQPRKNEPRCYTCTFREQERQAVIEERGAEWHRNPPEPEDAA